jgi:hypothetical protein
MKLVEFLSSEGRLSSIDFLDDADKRIFYDAWSACSIEGDEGVARKEVEVQTTVWSCCFFHSE